MGSGAKSASPDDSHGGEPEGSTDRSPANCLNVRQSFRKEGEAMWKNVLVSIALLGALSCAAPGAWAQQNEASNS